MPREGTATTAWSQELSTEARVADGAIRGAGIGLLWGIFHGPSEVSRALNGTEGAAAAARPMQHALMHGIGATLGFAVFLGGYNGIYSVVERRSGQKALGAFTAGGTMGAVLGAFSTGWPLKPVAIGGTAAGTALLCAGCQLLGDEPG